MGAAKPREAEEPHAGSGLRSWGIRWRGRDLWLGSGRLLIGRSSECHLSVSDPLVSRRHASISVNPDALVIEDLGSINGVYVNGRRIQGAHLLNVGDRVAIGEDELEVISSTKSGMWAGSRRREGDTISGLDPVVPAAPDDVDIVDPEPPPSVDATGNIDALELIGRVARNAIAEGRPEDAESMVRHHLEHVLEDVKRGRALSPMTIDAATRLAVALSQSTASPRWLDYLVRVYSALRAPLPEWAARDFRAAVELAPAIDVQALETYRSLLAQSSLEGHERSRALTRVEEVIAAARRARR